MSQPTEFYQVPAFACARCHKVHERDLDAYQCYRSHESKLQKLAEFTPHTRGLVTAVNEAIRRENKLLEPRGYEPQTEWDDRQPLPLFSESALYPLLGKDDARTVLALLRQAMEQEEKR